MKIPLLKSQLLGVVLTGADDAARPSESGALAPSPAGSPEPATFASPEPAPAPRTANTTRAPEPAAPRPRARKKSSKRSKTTKTSKTKLAAKKNDAGTKKGGTKKRGPGRPRKTRKSNASRIDPSRLTKSLVHALAPRHDPEFRSNPRTGPKPGRPEIEINTEDLALYVANGGTPMFWAREHEIYFPIVYRRIKMMKRVVGRWLEATVGPNASKDVKKWRPHKAARVWLTIDPEIREALADSRYDEYHQIMKALKR